MCECFTPVLMAVLGVMIGSSIGSLIGEWIADKIFDRQMRKKLDELRTEEDADLARLKDTYDDIN